MQLTGEEKWALLGASRGLGKAFAQICPTPNRIWSRQMGGWDFTQDSHYERGVAELADYSPSRLFYFAGGGPHGFFHQKAWKDHEWAYRVNLLFPARLVRDLLAKQTAIKQFVFIGSAIADSRPDPMAASYCSGKHGLRGLVETLQMEWAGQKDFLWLSPPYLNTDLLPRTAKAKLSDVLVEPSDYAGLILEKALGTS